MCRMTYLPVMLPPHTGVLPFSRFPVLCSLCATASGAAEQSPSMCAIFFRVCQPRPATHTLAMRAVFESIGGVLAGPNVEDCFDVCGAPFLLLDPSLQYGLPGRLPWLAQWMLLHGRWCLQFFNQLYGVLQTFVDGSPLTNPVSGPLCLPFFPCVLRAPPYACVSCCLLPIPCLFPLSCFSLCCCTMLSNLPCMEAVHSSVPLRR